MLRGITQSTLETQGYTVIPTRSPQDALHAVGIKNTHFDLLLTDVIMPEMNGAQMHERIREIRPDIKVLFMSGYSADAVVHRGVLAPGIAFIQKPFQSHDLTRKIREALRKQ